MENIDTFSTVALDPVFVNASDIGIPLDDKIALEKFQKAWNFLPVDSYVKKSGNARQRRHCKFKYEFKNSVLTREPHGDYFQSPENNSLYGGISRSFAPVSLDFSIENPWLDQLVLFNISKLPLNYPEILINCHFVRISSLSNSIGEPAPEGIHRDGFEYISIHLINKTNCLGGVTTIFDNNRKPLLVKELQNPFDSIYFNDKSCLHYTSPISVETTPGTGTRDVILCSYERYITLTKAR